MYLWYIQERREGPSKGQGVPLDASPLWMHRMQGELSKGHPTIFQSASSQTYFQGWQTKPWTSSHDKLHTTHGLGQCVGPHGVTMPNKISKCYFIPKIYPNAFKYLQDIQYIYIYIHEIPGGGCPARPRAARAGPGLATRGRAGLPPPGILHICCISCL